jgi:hypothetical protein
MTTTLTTRPARRRNAEVASGANLFHALLQSFVNDDRQGAIHLLNSIQPKHVAGYLLGRDTTPAEGQYFTMATNAGLTAQHSEGFKWSPAHDTIPEYLRPYVRQAIAYQYLAQTARVYLRGLPGDTRQSITQKFRRFVAGCKQSKR